MNATAGGGVAHSPDGGGDEMKITQSWKRNSPSTEFGESITVTINYSSQDRAEIDELEQKMPRGMLVMEVNSTNDGPR